MVGFGVLTYEAYKDGKQAEVILFIALAILFQPLFKIALGRLIWNIVDVIVAVGLIISIFTKPKNA